MRDRILDWHIGAVLNLTGEANKFSVGEEENWKRETIHTERENGNQIHDLQSRSTSPTAAWGIAAFKVIVISSALWGGDGVRPVWREDNMIQVIRVMSV